MRHLVIIAHPDDELVFMCPAMAEVLRSPAAVRIVYLTAGDAAKDEAYWRAREAAIRRAHAMLRPPGLRVACDFLRLADGMLQGQGSPEHNDESLLKLWDGRTQHMHALDGARRFNREALIEHLHGIIATFAPELLHTLNGLHNDPHEHADHHATGLFAAAAAIRASGAIPMRFYIGSNSPHMPANVTGAALADKTTAFAAYAREDAEIFNGRADWLSASIYAPMLARQYFTACTNRDLRVVGNSIEGVDTTWSPHL